MHEDRGFRCVESNDWRCVACRSNRVLTWANSQKQNANILGICMVQSGSVCWVVYHDVQDSCSCNQERLPGDVQRMMQFRDVVEYESMPWRIWSVTISSSQVPWTTLQTGRPIFTKWLMRELQQAVHLGIQDLG